MKKRQFLLKLYQLKISRIIRLHKIIYSSNVQKFTFLQLNFSILETQGNNDNYRLLDKILLHWPKGKASAS